MPRACAFVPYALHVSPAAALAAARALVPPLTEGSRRKGAHGRVLIVGGSETYVGAPLYAGMAALRTGADLVYLATSPGCAPPLKAQAPELMVLPCIPTEATPGALAAALAALEPTLARVHALVVGPGLGRSQAAQDFCAEVLLRAAARQPPLPTVVDADALYLVAQRPELLAGHPALLLTPNAGELARLEGKAIGAGVLILRKDVLDCVLLSEAAPLSAEVPVLATVEGLGSPRRCGGQGDVLAGAAGTFLAWAAAAAAAAGEVGEAGAEGGSGGGAVESGSVLAAAVGASVLTRAAAAHAFAAHRRGTLTPDILRALPGAFEACMEGAEE